MESNVQPAYVQESLSDIYETLFKKSNEFFWDVFLCGKAPSKKDSSMREDLRKKFDSSKKIRTLYPEDLFNALLKKNKNYDLLELESFLAKNSDIICIICESPGSLAELGAFANNNETADKVVALVRSKHKNDESFIINGVIKHLQKKNNSNVVFYSSDVDKAYEDFIKTLKNRAKDKKKDTKKDIDTFIGQYYLIVFILFMFKTVKVCELKSYVKYLVDYYNVEHKDFDLIYNSALKLLYKDSLIERTDKNKNEDFYFLTEKGNAKYHRILETINIAYKPHYCDKIRLSIMFNQFYKHCLS